MELNSEHNSINNSVATQTKQIKLTIVMSKKSGNNNLVLNFVTSTGVNDHVIKIC